MLLVSFSVGLVVILFSKNVGVPEALLLSCIGALAGTAAELFSPSEYDTVTVPIVILSILMLLEMV